MGDGSLKFPNCWACWLTRNHVMKLSARRKPYRFAFWPNAWSTASRRHRSRTKRWNEEQIFEMKPQPTVDTIGI